jgi:formate/nitrite transporter FocA (FNT family)
MKENLKVLTKGILAGIMISLGGTIYLLCENKMLGAFLFSIGLFAICVNGFNLYTGKIGYVIDNKISYLKELLFTLIGNLIGTVSCGYLLILTRSGSKLKLVAKSICETKLNDNLLSIFILAVFCGIIMYLAVDLYKKIKDFGKYVGIFMGITIFILCGFEHCVANMYYFSVANMWSLKTVLYVFIMILGNSTGSILLAILMKYGLKK